MNKFGMVVGLAAVATLAGCKNHDYKSDRVTNVQTTVKDIEVKEPVAAPVAKPDEAAKPVVTADLSKPAEPVKPVAPVVSVSPVEPETTIYIVQNGDYLAKISKRFNVTISSIKRLNPSIKKDIVWVGQKLKLPGKIDVGVQDAPKTAPAKKAAVSAYAGPTKEYVVKNGDTLGAIAYGNGITIRQLKALNGLSSDSLKIGQKLKVPAEKVVAAKPAAKKEVAKKPVAKKESEKQEAPVAVAPVDKPAEAAAAPVPEAEGAAAPTPAAADEKKDAEQPAPTAAAPAATTTYVVQEGDDMTGVSIRWGVSAADIRELNNMAEGDQLVPGQIIKLPAEAQQ